MPPVREFFGGPADFEMDLVTAHPRRRSTSTSGGGNFGVDVACPCGRERTAVMRAVVFALLFLAAMLLAGRGQAQDAREDLSAEFRVPANDPRKGPRLEFTSGPLKCPDEKRFRREVAYWVDGRDHLAADSSDVVRVRFAWTPHGHVASVAYTDAAGKTETLRVTKEGEEHCLLLARWVALKVSHRIPDKPPPEPCPACPACRVCVECKTCPPCVASCPLPEAPPKPPSWPMDLKIGLSAYGMMSWLLTPNVAPAVGVAIDTRGEVLSVGGEFRAVMPSRVLVTEPVPGAGSSFPVEMDVSQFSLLVVPCFRWKYFVGCAVGQLGTFIIQTRVQTGDDLVFGLGPRLGFEVPFADRFAVFGFGEALFAPFPAALKFTNPPPGMPDGPVPNVRWEQPVGSVFFGAGVSIHFK
jgi:hypothetical protein